MKKITTFFAFAVLFTANATYAQEKTEISQVKPINVEKQMKGFDEYANKLIKDWNCPGIGVGIVYKGKLVFAKGYGYRDYGKKLPVTPNTLFRIASNTKLFTAVSAGLLVDEGKLTWDKPIKNDVPTLNFYNDELNNTVTLRDMLGHRTGISRHDMIWQKSDINKKQIFDKIKYLEPAAPFRTKFLYNNLLFSTVGEVVEIKSGKTWEDFVKEKILTPLQMKTSTFEELAMRKTGDFVVPYNEKRDTDTLYEIPLYFDGEGLNPAGGLMSNINDISHWLTALMNDGKYNGKQVIPSEILKATLEPGFSFPNSSKYNELLNENYGLARMSAVYRGHLLLFHGGDLNGIHSQISMMPKEEIGVVVFVIGNQSQPLYDIISYDVYERLLGLSLTPWSERKLKDHIEAKKIDKEARSKVSNSQIPNTKPSHPMADYLGDFTNEPYGTITISQKGKDLQFKLNNLELPIHHYHYDRFDTDNDENLGQYPINYRTNPQGDIDGFTISLDEGEVFFNKKADASLTNPEKLKTYEGKYEDAGSTITVSLRNSNQLMLSIPGQPDYELVPYKENEFKLKEFSDTKMVFKLENGKVVSITQVSGNGEYESKKKD